MRTSLRVMCSVLLLFQLNVSSVVGFQQSPGAALQQGSFAINQPPILEDGTPVRLRISQTVSSADAHVDDKVEFEVLEDIKVQNFLVIPKGGVAWGTVTEAEPKRRMARGGKLEIVMDSVRLVDGEKAALRAVKEVKGGGHTGGMVAGIVVTGLILWPAAPFFLFMHGKDITIPKGTELPTFVNGSVPLELAKFQQTAPGAVATPQAVATATVAIATVAIASTPAGAEIFVDQNFVGNTPSSISAPTGNHLISVRKQGYKDWERTLAVSGGTVNLDAELVSGPNLPVAKSVAKESNPPRQAGITGITIGPDTQTQRPASAASPDLQTQSLATTADAATSPGWIGVTTHDGDAGKVVVSKVVANGQGAHAGLQVGDVISDLNGVPITSGEQFDVAISHCKPGSKAEITYVRGAGAWKSQATVKVGQLGS